ncbi:MFS transporter [Nakamurella aerolata]|uniref:MFS transporter n=1 Tax=Nakamurella aerolata TaxID=1656892 RepID=UPI001BB19810|nr:MFS transporter [Nakamurella aerolata]
MPAVVWLLGFAIFAQGTSELMIAGLLPELAAQLGVSIATGGQLVSVFALGMLIGAPVLVAATLRWPRRSTLLAFLAVFIVAQVAAAVTSSFAVVLASRFVGAFVYAGFWAVAAAVGTAAVGKNQYGKAMAVIAGGLTVATVVGLPAGTYLGTHLGWRAAFWAVAALSTIALVGVAILVPAGRSGPAPLVRAQLRELRAPRLWRSYALTAVSIAALLVSFSYLGAMLIYGTGVVAVFLLAGLQCESRWCRWCCWGTASVRCSACGSGAAVPTSARPWCWCWPSVAPSWCRWAWPRCWAVRR